MEGLIYAIHIPYRSHCLDILSMFTPFSLPCLNVSIHRQIWKVHILGLDPFSNTYTVVLLA